MGGPAVLRAGENSQADDLRGVPVERTPIHDQVPGSARSAPSPCGVAAHPGPPTPGWKSLLALVSLALSLLLWWNGLVESLERPSVMDSLSLRQLELTALATDALPESLRSGLAGDAPRKALVKELERQFEAAEAPAPVVRRLELELLQRSISPGSADQDQLRELMAMVDVPRRPLLKALIAGRPLEPSKRRSS